MLEYLYNITLNGYEEEKLTPFINECFYYDSPHVELKNGGCVSELVLAKKAKAFSDPGKMVDVARILVSKINSEFLSEINLVCSLERRCRFFSKAINEAIFLSQAGASGRRVKKHSFLEASLLEGTLNSAFKFLPDLRKYKRKDYNVLVVHDKVITGTTLNLFERVLEDRNKNFGLNFKIVGFLILFDIKTGLDTDHELKEKIYKKYGDKFLRFVNAKPHFLGKGTDCSKCENKEVPKRCDDV